MSLRRDSILFLVVGCAYALGSQMAFQWFDADGFSATFFPASGVTLSALALTAARRWPVVLAAVFTAEVLMDVAHDIPAAASIGYAFANVCEPLIGATLLRRFVHTPDLSRTRDLFVFLSCAVVVGPAVGGVIGATNYVTVAGGTEPWGDFMTQWWIGDGLGVLVVASAVLA
ncbi:MAG TPA: MASE1 domain-containing protein, partial [Solirubrobacterales bacterium]|nr:MASE1 domain-containing protein [Solirubrobacterales bacterium]